jgi:hypothetical protein
VINYARLEANLAKSAEQYRKAAPFPWVALENFLEEGFCEKLSAGFPEALSHKNAYGRQKHKHVQHKIGNPRWELMTELQRDFFRELNSDRFVRIVERITGIPKVYADDELVGGGCMRSTGAASSTCTPTSTSTPRRT